MTMRRLLLTLPPLVLAATAAEAQETRRVALDVGTTVGFSNNPFSQANGNTASGFVTVDVTPSIELIQEHSTVTATINAQVQQYFTQYPTTDSYRGTVSYNGRPSERLTTFLRADVSSAVLGGFDNLFSFNNGLANLPGSPVGATGTGTTDAGSSTTPPPIGPVTTGIGPTAGFANDLGLFGTRERRQSVYLTGGLSATLSSRDSLNVSAFGDIARYRNFIVSNYEGFGATVGYSRRLSAYTQLGVQGSYSRYDYNGPAGVSNIYSLQATGSTRINARWNVQGALGVTFVESGGIFPTNRTSLSSNIQLCQRNELGNLCFVASRDAQATGFNGSQYSTTAGVNYDRRISDRSRIGLSALYVTQGGIQQVGNGQTDYVSVSPNYSRQIGERLQLQASLRYRQIFGAVGNLQSDYGGQIGLSYHFGRLR